MKSVSRVQLFVTPWAVAQQAPLSMGFSRQEYWSGLPFPSPEDLPITGIPTQQKPKSKDKSIKMAEDLNRHFSQEDYRLSVGT